MSNTDQLERNLEQDRDHLRQTLGALEDKMSPGRLLDEAMSHFNTGPKAFASELTAQVRDNPIPALLTGVGLAWLMMSNQKRTDPETDVSADGDTDGFGFAMDASDYEAWHEHDRLQQAEWSCVRQDAETADAHARRLDQSRAAALGLPYDPQEDHASFSTRVRSAADAVKQKGVSAREKLQRAAASAKHGTGSAAAAGKDGLKSAAHSTKSGAKAAASSALQLYETNPIATAAIGVALGALFGAALPLSRKEEEVLGGVTDKVMAKGADLSRQASDAVTERLQSAGASDDRSPASAASI